MKVGWQTKTIGEVCEVIAGQSPEGKFYNTDGEGLPFYQGKKEFSDKFIGEPTTWTSSVTKEAMQGDILMSVRAPVGPVNFATQRICIGRGLASIRAKEVIDRDFLFYFLRKHEAELVGNTGAVFNSINKTQIENTLIPLPPLPEQQRIVTILDQAFEGIAKATANAEKNLANARELFEAHVHKFFFSPDSKWEEKRLKDVTTELVTGPFGSMLHKSDYVANGIPVVNPQNIIDGAIVPFDKTMVSEATRARLARFSLRKKDIIIARRGEMGRCAVVDEPHAGWLCGTGSMIIRLKDNASEKYIVQLLQSSTVRKRLEGDAVGATMSNLNQDILLGVSFHLPPLQEQINIIGKLEELSAETQRLETIYQQKLKALEDLKKSILHQAFTGQLN